MFPTHVETYYSKETGVWTSPRVVESHEVTLSGLSPALNYGQQAFEGLKAFRRPDGAIILFRPRQHAHRLNHSASFVCIPAVPEPIFMDCLTAVITANAAIVPAHDSGSALYIRPVVFGSGSQFIPIPSLEYTLAVYVSPTPPYMGLNALDVLVEEAFDRSAPLGTGSAKLGGNYGPLMRHVAAAKDKNFGMTLYLDSRTRTEIEEFETSAFVGLRKTGSSYTLVTTNSPNVIKSITADSCVLMAKSLGWTTESRPIKFSELCTFDEVLAVGTAAFIVPVRRIHRPSTNENHIYLADDQQIGPASSLLRNSLSRVQRGLDHDSFGWTESVGVDI